MIGGGDRGKLKIYSRELWSWSGYGGDTVVGRRTGGEGASAGMVVGGRGEGGEIGGDGK